MTEISKTITDRLKKDNKRFWACDNISEYILEDEKQLLIEELTGKFEGVLDSLIVDRENDPNSHDTGRRMAKMYVNELFMGRYTPFPNATAFPNVDKETRYAGILITKAEVKSMCSHHHQPVRGTCWIGIIPGTKVIGLSKYARIAHHLARRGTLQEELTRQISDEIMRVTETQDVGVVISASHGCCENRGIMAHDSTTVTSVVNGQFFKQDIKDEFHRLIHNAKTMRAD